MICDNKREEAIECLKGHISAIALYVTEAKLDEEEVENEDMRGEQE